MEHLPSFEGERLLRINLGPLALVVALVAEGVDLGLDAVLHRHDRRDARFGRVLARHEECRHRESLHLAAGEIQVADLPDAVGAGHLGVLVVRDRQELPLLAVAVRFAHPREVRGADSDHGHALALGNQHGCYLLRSRILLDLGVAALAVRRRPREVNDLEAEAELIREDVGRVEAATPGVHGAALQAVEALEDRRGSTNPARTEPRQVHPAFLDLAIEHDDLEVLVVEAGHHLHALHPARILFTHVEREVVLEDARTGHGRLLLPDVVVVVDGAARLDHAGRIAELADLDQVGTHRVVGTRRRTGRDDHRLRHALAEGGRGEERSGDGDGDGGELETHDLNLLVVHLNGLLDGAVSGTGWLPPENVAIATNAAIRMRPMATIRPRPLPNREDSTGATPSFESAFDMLDLLDGGDVDARDVERHAFAEVELLGGIDGSDLHFDL